MIRSGRGRRVKLFFVELFEQKRKLEKAKMQKPMKGEVKIV